MWISQQSTKTSIEHLKRTSIDPRDDLTLAKDVFKIFCSGLRYSMTEEDIRPLFQPYGTVISVIIPIRKAGTKPGYAIIYMSNRQDGLAAINGLDRREVAGFRIVVREWKPAEERSHKLETYDIRPPAPPSGQRDIEPRRDYRDDPRDNYDNRRY